MFSQVCHSVGGGGSHVTITYVALDLAVRAPQIPKHNFLLLVHFWPHQQLELLMDDLETSDLTNS